MVSEKEKQLLEGKLDRFGYQLKLDDLVIGHEVSGRSLRSYFGFIVGATPSTVRVSRAVTWRGGVPLSSNRESSRLIIISKDQFINKYGQSKYNKLRYEHIEQFEGN